MAPNITLLDLVNAVAEYSRSEAEVIATAARFDLTRIAEA